MGKVVASGSAIKTAKVNNKNVFLIHNVTDPQSLTIRIEGPNGLKCEPKLTATETDVLVEYVPTVTGEYVIHIQHNNLAIFNSPFTVKVYDINQIKVKEMPKTIQLDKPASFIIDSNHAGPGMLEVSINNGGVTSEPKQLEPAVHSITFVPTKLIDHNIQIIFNNEMVNGSPFILKTVKSSFPKVLKPQNDRIPVDHSVTFHVKSPSNIKLSEGMFIIYSPIQKRIKPEIRLIDENNLNSLNSDLKSDDSKQELEDELVYEVKFVPKEVGDHLVDLKIDGHSVCGCPFLMKVYDSKKVKISGLNNGVLGKPVYFSIDASQAGAGNLEIIVSVSDGTNSRNVPNYVESEGQACFKVHFTPINFKPVNFKPKEAIPHLIRVSFNGEPVPGSPYTMPILMDNQNEINLAPIVTNLSKLRMCSLNKGVRMILNKYAIHQVLNKIASHLPPNVTPTGYPEISIQTPSNQRYNLELVDKKTEYEGLYLAKEVGPHQIYVHIDKYLINSVPINCNVYDVSKVKVSGLELVILGKPCCFQVDASHAGEGTLELVVTTRKCSVKAEVLTRSRGLYNVTFLPEQQTQYFVNVTFNEEDVIGSPFKVDVQPANTPLDKLSQLTVSNQLTDVVDRAFPSLSLENQTANELIQQQSINGKISPNLSAATHSSQFDPTKIIKGIASTENATCLVGSINIVYIELDDQLLKQLQHFQKQQQHTIEACVFNPQNNLINSNLTYDLLSNKNSNKLKLDYTPKEIGTYRIELINAINQESLLNHPIFIECCDPSRVRLLNVTDGIVGKQQQFTIDASRAGCGSLQLSVTCKQQQVPFELFEYGPNNTQIKISSLNSTSTKINSKSGVFLVKYKPEIDLPHYIDVLYNGHQCAGCPQLIQISDATELLTIVKDSISKSIQLNVDTEILIEESSTSQGLIELSDLSCKIFDCDNKSVENRFHELSDSNGTKKKQFKIEFKPIKIGTHRIEIYYLNNHLHGSPLLTECFNINKVKLQPIQNTNFIVNEKIFLSLDRKDAGYAELDVVVTSPLGRHLPIELTANDQKELICFIPTVQGKYKIAISYGHLSVPGTPITFIANQASAIEANKTNGDSAQAQQQPNQLKPLTNGNQTNHLSNNNNLINNSLSNHSNQLNQPQQSQLNQQQLNQQLNQQQINQQNKKEPINKDQQPIIMFKQMSGNLNERFVFTIDSNGYKGLPLINIDGPEQEEDLLVEEKNRVFYVSFVPVQIGIYEIRISWSGREIAKPFKINIVNLNAIKPKQGWKSLFTNQDKQSIIFSLNQQFKITFLTNDVGQGKLIGEILLPNGKVQGNIVEHASSNKYKLYFTPKLNGKYVIRLFYSGLLLPQCPIIACTNAQYLMMNGNASLDNQINNQILNGMQKDSALIHQQQQQQQQKASTQQRKLSMNQHDNEVCVTLKGQGLAGAQVGQVAQFIVDGTAAGPGSPQCTLKISESDFKLSDLSEEDRPVLNVTEIQNKIFKVSYKAKISGTYILNILWGNKQVSGCPLKLQIDSNSDSNLIEVIGFKETCQVNKAYKLQIDTSKAPPGQLIAHCTGPKKVAVCSLIDDESNGIYQLNFTPQETGKHILTIKYGNEHIAGSPFSIKVNSQSNGSEPDSSKVKVYGPGIEHGVLPLYQSRFVCETKGAGAGQLVVRIRGPKKAFRVEMARDSTKERSIICRYDPTEPGHYRIEIKWSNEHVPNSPFDVYIFDTQYELSRFLNDRNSNSNLPHSISSLSNTLPLTSADTLPHHLPPALLAPQPISFKTLPHPGSLAHHPHLPPMHPIQLGAPHYSLNHHIPAFPGPVPLNSQFLSLNNPEFFNPYTINPIHWRGGPHEL